MPGSAIYGVCMYIYNRYTTDTHNIYTHNRLIYSVYIYIHKYTHTKYIYIYRYSVSVVYLLCVYINICVCVCVCISIVSVYISIVGACIYVNIDMDR